MTARHFDPFNSRRVRAIRRGIIAQGQETAAPDFGRMPAPLPTVKADPA